jgi:hypothetical protein
VVCDECGQEFTVTTNVSYEFESPEMIGNEEDDRDVQDD